MSKSPKKASAPVLVEYQQPAMMAEIGCNHMGEFEIAKELLTLAKECGAAYGKFQKRNPKELLTKEQYNAPHPNPRNSYGDTYGEHRENLELTVAQHGLLKKHCDEIGLGYSCSVWDTTSAKEIVTLKPDLIKVGSPSNQHWEMQKVLRDEYTGDVHISTGMTTKDEIEKIVKFWEQGKGNAKERVVLYNCTSGYPVPFENVCMLDLRELHAKYAHRVKALGFSGHHLGIAVDIAAYAMGATWFERHFTKDRTWKGTDHAASLEPAGLQKLCRDLQATHKCMTYKEEEILPIEKEQRAKLKWGCYNAKQVKRPSEPKSPKSPKSPQSTTTTKKSEPSPKKTKA
jgi:N-acetylneuraminate synthase